VALRVFPAYFGLQIRSGLVPGDVRHEPQAPVLAGVKTESDQVAVKAAIKIFGPSETVLKVQALCERPCGLHANVQEELGGAGAAAGSGHVVGGHWTGGERLGHGKTRAMKETLVAVKEVAPFKYACLAEGQGFHQQVASEQGNRVRGSKSE